MSSEQALSRPEGQKQTPSSRRRRFLKAGATSLTLGGVATQARAALPASPPTTPFLRAMPIPAELQPVPVSGRGAHASFVANPPTPTPNRAINPLTSMPFEGRGDAHQARNISGEPVRYFVQRYGAVPAFSIHSELPGQVNFWGANRGGDLAFDRPTVPNPTIVSRYDEPILVRRINQLPSGIPSGGYGKNSISMHLHNFHTAPDSDGGPCDPALGGLAENPLTQGRFFFPGQYYDHYYSMRRAGFTTDPRRQGDIRESLGTLWYHDHREAHTAENVYKGLAGFHLIFNALDTGNENTGLKLPSYPQYDIPIAFIDLAIDPATGQATLDLLNTDGHLGDKYLVNGQIQPFFNVECRRYRFRLLNQGPSRAYELYLTNPDNPAQSIPYWRIANDGNLYEKPLQVTRVRLAPAERADLIVDFNRLTARGGPAAGATRLWLENRLVQDDPNKPKDQLHPPAVSANVLVEFRPRYPTAQLPTPQDNSADPALITSLLQLPPLTTPTVTRTFKFGKGKGGWTVNGKLIDCGTVSFTMKRGRPERWIYETGGGWKHPIHHHFVEGRIMKRNGVAIGPGHQEYCRKDVVVLWPGDTVEYWVTPTDYVGVYPIHCHNVIHEDAGMMVLFRVDDIGDTNPAP